MSTADLQEELSYEDAMKILGYEPGVIISPHLPAFRKVAEKIAELVRVTKDEKLQGNYREELSRLNDALQVVEAEKYREPPTRARGMGVRLVLSLFLAGCVVAAGWYGNSRLLEGDYSGDRQILEALAADARRAVEGRKWDRAESIYAELAELEPDSLRVREGLRRIAEGREEALRQKLGFVLGSARAAIEGRNWEEAESRLKELVGMEEAHPEAGELRRLIREGQVTDRIAVLLESAQEALQEEQWSVLSDYTAKLESIAPGHEQLARFKTATAEGMRILEERRIRARGLYEKALALDKGEFSESALETLREAIRLDNRKEYQDLYNKMSAYTRLLMVPRDYSTISEALASARPNDKIRIGEGTFTEALTLNVKVDLEGAGHDKSIIQCDAASASVLLVTKEASGSRVASVTMRQTGIALTEERYPVAFADGSELALEDCRIDNGSGHGVAVINGGVGRLRNVQVSKCGWDGLAVNGEGSTAECVDCRFDLNFHHGIDAWGGGQVVARKTRTSRNGLAGVVLMSKGVQSELVQCTIDGNREVGVSISNGAIAVLKSNRVQGNLLGGVMVEGDGTTAGMEENVAEKNYKFGIMADRRSTVHPFRDNITRGNTGEQLKLEVVMPEEVVPPPSLLDISAKKPGEAGPAPSE
ncbi:MAG: right-handed parallel beta-helix repeat-containing protein [Roseibacillus sp.]|nr:right-handed parallel beta-helix repeat-containing protein [Roseibacillus sp.]